MTYKGYVGSVTFDDDAGILFGTDTNIDDVITFHGTSVDEIRQAFRDSSARSRERRRSSPGRARRRVRLRDPRMGNLVTQLELAVPGGRFTLSGSPRSSARPPA